MVSETRWKDAQKYEQGYWDQVAAEAEAEGQSRLGGYRWRAEQLARMLGEAGVPDLASGSSSVLEVGSGPIGIIGFFPASQRVAVDPLEDFYVTKSALVASRHPGVSYRCGTGEALPVDSGEFDLAMIENCIDHCRDMKAVMADISRALKPRGHLYLPVNARCRPGYYVHRALSRLKIDAGHPHTFTRSRVRSFLQECGYDVLHVETGSLLKAWIADLRGPGAKRRVKGLLGVSEYLVSVIAQKRA